MVGRSKPQKNMERKMSVEINNAENLYLKAKNVDLAKALADAKNAYSQMVEERDFLQRELFTANLRSTKLENYIKNIDTAARACINSVVASSNHITEVLQITNSIQRLTSLDEMNTFRSSMPNNSANSSPGLSNKTQAVKPMIGGHVIFRPTINLRRVNEIPTEEIQRLQSSSNHTQINNHDSARDDINSSGGSPRDSPPTGSSFQCRSSTSNVRTFRNHPQFVGTSSEPRDNQGVEELSDHSSEVSDMTSTVNNGLDTVQEEQELENTLNNESHINPLTNPNTSTISIPGGSPQVPLLSGVFRDVRVYLSPMQDVAQYLDPLQNVTKERGPKSSYKSKRTQSIHSSRSTENVRCNSGANRKFSVVCLSSPTQNVNVNNSAQNTTAASSPEVSCNSVLQNSLLTSTKICSPKSLHVTKPDNSNYMNNPWPNITGRFEDSVPNQSTFSESGRTSFDSRSNSSEKWTSVKERRNNSFPTKVAESSKKSYPISSSKCMTSTSTDYDPLEGPSTMLDSFDTEIKNKIETLSGLGLTPTFLENNTSTPHSPSSPAAAVLQRRERSLKESNDLTPKKAKKAIHLVKRRSIEKKKGSLVSTKVAKVMIRRISITRGHGSGSPQRRSSGSLQKRNLINSQKKSSVSPQKKSSVSPQKKSTDSPQKKISDSPQKKSLSNPQMKNLNPPLKRKNGNSSPENKPNTNDSRSTNTTSISKSTPEVTPLSKIENIPKKRGRKSKIDKSKIATDKKSETSTSPKKRGRPRRIPQASLKEPSLRKKLRRS